MGGLDDIQVPKAPSPPGLFPNTGPDTLSRMAAQTRPLNPAESGLINQRYKGGLDPLGLRIGFDSSLVGTNVLGHVNDKLGPVVFLPPNNPNTLESLPHESAHIWQHYGQYPHAPTDQLEHWGYDWDKWPRTDNFKSLGKEEQAEAFQASDPRAVSTLQSNRVNVPLGEGAFLDSIRERQGKKASSAGFASYEPSSVKLIEHTTRTPDAPFGLKFKREDYSKRLRGLDGISAK